MAKLAMTVEKSKPRTLKNDFASDQIGESASDESIEAISASPELVIY